jgi:hypothetical protein
VLKGQAIPFPTPEMNRNTNIVTTFPSVVEIIARGKIDYPSIASLSPT